MTNSDHQCAQQFGGRCRYLRPLIVEDRIYTGYPMIREARRMVTADVLRNEDTSQTYLFPVSKMA